MMQLPESRNLAPFKNKNEKNGTKQVDFAKPSFKDTQKMGESLVPHSMWSFRDDINSYSDLVKKVVHENGQRANHRKASILDKYVFPVKHANSEDNKRSMGEDGYQKHRFHDGLQNFEPDHHVLQLDRSPKELVYKFQSDTDNINHGDSESTRPETCKGCMNLGFTYLVNGSTICQKGRNGLDLLILVASDPVNELARTAIRSTWGRICRRPDSNIACVFMIANTPNLYLNQQVFKESLKHEDIVIFSFMDAYTNLTFKSLMGLRWSQQFCPQASYIMKTDEDVYVNTHQIPIMLRAAPSEGFVGGFCWGQSRPSRDPSNKWHVSYNQYAREFFPPMCSGTGYILSHDLVISILKVSPNIPFFNLEDVYIAFCFQELGILPINIQGFSNMRTDFQSCEYKYYVMTSHQISEMEMIDFWEEIQTCPDHAFSPQELYNPLMLPDLTE
ncbi:beta-1,3-galactosyltransferase 5-like [Liolophura sinensis]|uniref:beta-1,3-galactosyltransferase 5-like n=1 Tax=Liolophura sinensis TaxID=3198878 RepID=UPI0031592B6E